MFFLSLKIWVLSKLIKLNANALNKFLALSVCFFAKILSCHLIPSRFGCSNDITCILMSSCSSLDTVVEVKFQIMLLGLVSSPSSCCFFSNILCSFFLLFFQYQIVWANRWSKHGWITGSSTTNQHNNDWMWKSNCWVVDERESYALYYIYWWYIVNNQEKRYQLCFKSV